MAQQWSMEWFNENAPIIPPAFASLAASLDGFKFKEPAMQGTPENAAQPDTTANAGLEAFRDKVDALVDSVLVVANDKTPDQLADQNTALRKRVADLEKRNSTQHESIQTYQTKLEDQQAQILELSQAADLSDGAHILTAEVAHDGAASSASTVKNLKAQLARALHTQKVLERDLEEYQQAYADLKTAAFSDDDGEEEIPPRILEFGYGLYLVYPAKVCESDDGTAPKWGIIIDPDTDRPTEKMIDFVGKPLVLTDGDVAITFAKPQDVPRLINTLTELYWHMVADIASKDE